MRRLAESDIIGIVTADAAGHVSEANDYYLRLIGCSREELSSGRIDWRALTPPEWLPADEHALDQLRERGTCTPYEKEYVRRDGSRVPVLLVDAVLPGPEERLLALVLDLTERKRAEEARDKLQTQLVQAGKMEAVGSLAGGVAHDFNNMLTVVKGCAEMAMEKLPPVDPARAEVAEILAAADRSAALVRQLLAFARKQTIAPKVLDLNDAIASMLSMLRRLIGEDVELVWKPGANLGSVKMDPSQIGQLLANLVINARDAVAGVGRVAIDTAAVRIDETERTLRPYFVPGTYVVLTVSDDGCGMDEKVQAQIFEPFFSTKPRGRGTGLGLATVYGIVKQNGGFIDVYSEPGLGSTFAIYLPAQESKASMVTVEPRESG
jgi:PAS domain S-box-containing protein